MNNLQASVKTLAIKLSPCTLRKIRIMAANESERSAGAMASKLLDAAVAHIK